MGIPAFVALTPSGTIPNHPGTPGLFASRVVITLGADPAASLRVSIRCGVHRQPRSPAGARGPGLGHRVSLAPSGARPVGPPQPPRSPGCSLSLDGFSSEVIKAGGVWSSAATRAEEGRQPGCCARRAQPPQLDSAAQQLSGIWIGWGGVWRGGVAFLRPARRSRNDSGSPRWWSDL